MMLDKRLFTVHAVPLLMTIGATVHLVNVSNYIYKGAARIGDVLTPVVDIPLAILMTACGIGMVAYRKLFFNTFKTDSKFRKIFYYWMTFYIVASIPGHFMFILMGNTSYFDFFPWWFSLIIIPIYVIMVMYFVTLKPSEKKA